MVTVSISPKGEMISEATQGVGEAHSTHDVKDSITFMEERRLTVCMPVPGGGGLHSPLETQRGTRI